MTHLQHKKTQTTMNAQTIKIKKTDIVLHLSSNRFIGRNIT